MVNINGRMSGGKIDIFEGQIDLGRVVMRLGRQFGLHGKGFDRRLKRGFYPRSSTEAEK